LIVICLSDTLLFSSFSIHSAQSSTVYIDDFITTKTRAQAWTWMIENRDKPIWIIDRNDFYKSSSACTSCDRMKLIQTEIWLGNIPDEVLNQ